MKILRESQGKGVIMNYHRLCGGHEMGVGAKRGWLADGLLCQASAEGLPD